MRRFWKSSEFWRVLVAGAALWFLARPVLPLLYLTILVNALVVGYLAARVLWKRNRGQYYSATLTSEFYLSLAAQVFNAWALLQGLDPKIAWCFIIGLEIYFMRCRGLTKTIGMKTQVVL